MTRRLTALLVVLLTGAAACAGSRPATVPRAKPTARSVYVAIGNGETAGNGVRNRIRDAWPQIVFRTVFGRGTVFTNFGRSDTTVREALTSQVAPALRLRPTVATVHLTEDTFLTRDPVGYETDLERLVRRLQDHGSTIVVLGNIPPGDREPGVLACLPAPPPAAEPCRIGRIDDLAERTARDDAFNAAIARVAEATGAHLVDLHAAFLAARAQGREDALYAGNDFSPNVAGHAFMARQFGRVIRAALDSGR